MLLYSNVKRIIHWIFLAEENGAHCVKTSKAVTIKGHTVPFDLIKDIFVIVL